MTVTVNVARTPGGGRAPGARRDVSTREETNLDDLGLEVGAALAEAGPEELLGER